MTAPVAAPEAALYLVFSTVPAREEGERIAEALVSEGLAACVQLLPGLLSVYRWQGALERSAELLLVAKTLRPADCLARLAALHPYQVPEGIAVAASAVLPDYLRWALDSAKEAQDSATRTQRGKSD
ncbi:divalent-cation tolerance protein CutA [bacterium]|nr:divalent-cation tolerance protein CutA [bacterium]